MGLELESGSQWESGSHLDSGSASAHQESHLASGSALVMDSASESASESAPELESGLDLAEVPETASGFPWAPDSVMYSALQPD